MTAPTPTPTFSEVSSGFSRPPAWTWCDLPGPRDLIQNRHFACPAIASGLQCFCTRVSPHLHFSVKWWNGEAYPPMSPQSQSAGPPFPGLPLPSPLQPNLAFMFSTSFSPLFIVLSSMPLVGDFVLRFGPSFHFRYLRPDSEPTYTSCSHPGSFLESFPQILWDHTARGLSLRHT